MDKHINDQELYTYLFNNSSDESNKRVSRHIAGCKECLERTKAVMYLREHFDEEWEDLSLGSIVKLNKELDSIKNKEKVRENKIIFLANYWRKVISVAAVLIIVIGIGYFQHTKDTENQYSKWKKLGVVSSTKKLDDKVSGQALKNMVAGLAGTKDIDLNKTSYKNKKLLVSDATEVIADTFSLSNEDRKSMLKDMNLDSYLTYKKVLDMFGCFAGEVYSNNMDGKNIKDNLTVNSSGKTLKNVSVSGNLYLMQGVGSGEVVLNNVKVNGSVYVLGGGESTIILEKSNMSNIIVNKSDGRVRVLAKEGTQVQNVKLESGAKLQNGSTSGEVFKRVLVSSKLPVNSEVKLDGKFSFINVDAPKIKVIVETGIIKELNLSKSAEKTEIILLGDSVIEKLNADASVLINGTGSIDTANINVKNVGVSVKIKVRNIPKEVKDTGVDQVIPGEVKSTTVDQLIPDEVKSGNLQQVLPNEVKDSGVDQLIPNEVKNTTVDQLIPDKVKNTNLEDLLKKH